MNSDKHIIAGITGASGAVYARHVLRMLSEAEVHIELVISRQAHVMLRDELGINRIDADSIAGAELRNVSVHDPDNVGARIASGSSVADAMIICPCSSNTLGAIASGLGSNLMQRAAYVCLKERRRVVLVHREAPLTSIDIDNMAKVTLAGAIVYPASPVFYTKPASIDDIASNLAARVLILAGLDVINSRSWVGK
jgi:4-hydroxy-3-polyprenylbenzoate decarboxylase